MVWKAMQVVYIAVYWVMIIASGINTWPKLGWYDWWGHMAIEVAWYAPLWPAWLLVSFVVGLLHH